MTTQAPKAPSKQKMTMKPNPFPTIDGHFWVVRNGQIIDTDFKEYNSVKMINGCSGGMVYKEADKITQKIMTAMFMKCLESMGFDMESFKRFSVENKRASPRFNSCFQNCLTTYQEGDEIKFGSMGWKYLNNCRVWWEYGGEDWAGVKAFLK